MNVNFYKLAKTGWKDLLHLFWGTSLKVLEICPLLQIIKNLLKHR